MTMTKKRNIIILAVGLLGSEIAWKVWKYFIGRSGVEEKKEVLSEVLVFSEHGKLCRDHANTRIPCDKSDCPVGSMGKLQRYLSALKTLDVCMYVMTAGDLVDAILKSHRRGASVRIIIDSGMSDNPACDAQLLRLRRAGIQIRTNRLHPSTLMHHKFALIDGKVLLFGSTNWTMQAFFGNNDSIIVTNLDEFVTIYSNEFEKMWTDFES